MHQTKLIESGELAEETSRHSGPEGRAPETPPETPPLFVIQPTRGFIRFDLKELWHYRDLLYFLTWREISIRYKQTVFGFLWAVFQPLMTMVVFTIFFGRLAGMPSDGIAYPLFSYLGLLPWTYFSAALSRSGISLVGNANLVSKVYFPRILIPMSGVLSALVDFALAALVLVGLLAWWQVVPAASSILLIPLVLLTAAGAMSVGMLLSALNVQYRDIQHAIPFLVQLWMFATPVAYPASIVPERWRPLYALNPMVGIIEGYRSAVMGTPMDWMSLGIATVVILVTGIFAIRRFRKMERTFADVV